MAYTASFDLTVYSDAGLTAPIVGGIQIRNSFTLPQDVYFSNPASAHLMTGKNDLGDTLYTVSFTPNLHLTSNIDGSQNISTSATWD